MFSKRNPSVGSRPGTLAIPKESPAPRLHMINYFGSETIEEHFDDLASLDKLHESFSDDRVAWVDVQGFGNKSFIRRLGEVFDLHPLLLEDIVNAPQRPKTEAYENVLLMIVRMVQVHDEMEIDAEQVSVILGPNYVVTFQERYGDVLDPVRKRIRSGKGPIREHGADFLAYAIVDTIIDGYYPVIERIGDRLESYEDEVIANPTPDLLSRLHRLKNQLVNMRRSIWPQREAINSLVRGDDQEISDDVRIFFRDTYDHCAQTSEVTEMYREMVTGLMNTYLSSVANRTNEVMKVLTITATIFIPLTFLAGIYGMNFEYMPELQVRWAYPLIWITMLLSATGMIGFFWKKGLDSLYKTRQLICGSYSEHALFRIQSRLTKQFCLNLAILVFTVPAMMQARMDGTDQCVPTGLVAGSQTTPSINLAALW